MELLWYPLLILPLSAWYGIVAFFVERSRLKNGMKPCRNLWPLVLIGFLTMAVTCVLTLQAVLTADLAFCLLLATTVFTGVLLWIAVGVSAAKLFCSP